MKKNMFNAGPEFWEPFEYEVHNLPADVSYYVGRKTLNLILKENMHCPEQLLVALKAEFEKVFSIGYTMGKLGKTKARLEEEDLMYRFDKKCVHFIWDDELEGKKVIYADDIPSLIECVDAFETCELEVVSYSENDEYPFLVNDNKWMFIYYDPNYEAKLAYEQGKKIECKRKGDAWGDLDWDYTPSPAWLDDHEYRIMKEEPKPVTNRELAKWLAQGNGEYQLRKGDEYCCFYEYAYDAKDANEPTEIPCVRKWNDSEWHEPTREYMGLD